MDAQQFLAEFGHIASAPDGVSRLRELVLQLAISGGLAARDETDTPVDRTLAEVAEDRVAYEVGLELRAARHHPPLSTSPFAIPAHWKWVRLEQLVLYIQRGKGPRYATSGKVSVVSQKCIQWSGFDMAPARCLDDDSVGAYGKERFLCNGDLLWNSTGTGTAGRVAIVQGVALNQAVADSHVTVVRLGSSLPRYVWCVIASPWVQARIHPAHADSLVSGTTQQVELATSTARALAVPCPPVEEQLRIVARVDELMALCDQLDRQQKDRRKLQNALRQSTLQALVSAQSPHELQTSWLRLQATFGALFSEPGDVNEVRRLVLVLAANGHLSMHLNGDDDPESLLEQMKSDQLENLSTREIREIQTLPEPANGDGRLRVALGHVVKLISGQHLAPDEYNTTRDGVPYITGPAEFKSNKPVPSKWTNERRALAIEGDILITVKGSGVGKTAICDVQELAISRQLMAIRALRGIDLSYLSICVDAAEQSFQSKKFGVAIPGIGRDEVLNLGILLPSLAEQRRIVAVVAGLVLQCDELEARLQNAVTTAQRLAAREGLINSPQMRDTTVSCRGL
ncbi:restriction endonuclease subunit S, partial [Xanthomonas arboricola]|uniref:restriction endonuclease subunit S n=1 Tax=Xanthomonas arboricola TaxID=56448 RepID=UPI0011B01B9B